MPERIKGVNFFDSPEFDFAQAPQSVRDRSVLIFYAQNFIKEVMTQAYCLHLKIVEIRTRRLLRQGNMHNHLANFLKATKHSGIAQIDAPLSI